MRSGRQFSATLAAPSRENGPPGAGTHAQPEPVGPGAATVVRLKRTLALGHGCRSPGAWCLVLLCRIAAVGTAGSQSGHPLPAPGGTAASESHPVRGPYRAMGEGTQECPPVGGRRPEPRRPIPAPSKPGSRVTVRATRRYIGGACLHGVLVAAPRLVSLRRLKVFKPLGKPARRGPWERGTQCHPQLWTTLWTPALLETTSDKGAAAGVRAAKRPRPGVE
jgi:hypothetical protein